MGACCSWATCPTIPLPCVHAAAEPPAQTSPAAMDACCSCATCPNHPSCHVCMLQLSHLPKPSQLPWMHAAAEPPTQPSQCHVCMLQLSHLPSLPSAMCACCSLATCPIISLACVHVAVEPPIQPSELTCVHAAAEPPTQPSQLPRMHAVAGPPAQPSHYHVCMLQLCHLPNHPTAMCACCS